jgi:hypothetical protein
VTDAKGLELGVKGRGLSGRVDGRSLGWDVGGRVSVLGLERGRDDVHARPARGGAGTSDRRNRRPPARRASCQAREQREPLHSSQTGRFEHWVRTDHASSYGAARSRANSDAFSVG